MHAIAIHGGAGAMPRAPRSPPSASGDTAPDSRPRSTPATPSCEHGGTSLDAVTTAVRILEDDPMFNAGHGAALTRDGAAELDAAIMEGREMRAGAVASVRHVKNPDRACAPHHAEVAARAAGGRRAPRSSPSRRA